MLSIDLFDSTYEKRLHEGAVDNTIEHLLKPLSIRAAEIRTQLRSGRLKPKQIDQLEKEYEDLVQQRLDIMLDRRPQTEQQQSQRTPAKGLLKGKDLVTPQQRVAAATPPKPGMMGAVKDVVGGIKRFVKGEPDQGPTYENQQPQQSPRALGVANFQRLVKANMGNIPTVSLEFIRPEENFKLDQKGLDLISDYYDGLESDQAKNYFIYRVLPSGEETQKVLKQLGWTTQQVQPSLPGIPTQGELPLQEKKKSNSDDLEAGDVKVARELQKLRAQYPAALSDVEAVARAEIDSTERSQQQLSAIRGANEKQDALLKQLVALDQEQGREISGLDKENNSLEQRLAQVQSTNNRLQQAIGNMTGAKKSAAKTQTAAPQGSADMAQGGIIDVGTTAAPTPDTTSADNIKPTTRSAMGNITRTITGLSGPSPSIDKDEEPKPVDQEPEEKPVTSLKGLRPKISANRDEFRLVGEHGGGIGPRQHWQDLMQETVVDVKSGMAQIYRRLAPKIERYKDSFLAGQLYDELENYAELHGAEREFKQMMAGARNRAHMEYDTNPGGFHNWFWFLPFEDEQVEESTDDIKKRMSKLETLALAANRAGDDAKCKMYQQKIQSLKQKLSQSMAEGKIKDIDIMRQDLDSMSDLQFLRAHGMNKGQFTYKYRNLLKPAPQQDVPVQESLRPGEYYIHTVYFKDGTKKRIRVTSDEFDVTDYYTKRGQTVDRVDYDFQIHSDMIEGEIKEEALVEGIRDTASATAVIACLLTGGSLTGCATAPQQTSAQQVLKTGQDIGRTVQIAKRITRAGTEAEVQQELRNILRGVSGRPEELNHSNILRIWRRVNEPKPQQNEAREIISKEDFVRERDRLLRMIGQETNPANKQILKSAIRQLENRAENEGWITMQTRMVREDSDGGEAVEMAIMRRMLVAHTDLIVEFGLDKVVDAIEEVAYNVGDVDEIGTSDVSAYVAQVKQILGVDA